MAEDIFDDRNRVKAKFFKFGKVGDWFKGTLLSVLEKKSTYPGKEGQLVKQYEFKVHGGQFHVCDPLTKQPYTDGTGVIDLVPGDIWIVSPDNESFDNSMRNVKVGQIFASKFTELKPSKTPGFNAQKVRPVYAGGMDPDYMGETAVDTVEAFGRAV